jgi:alpha-N-acetylglucosamine transferase
VKFLTFTTGIPGSRVHAYLRSLYDDDTLIYKENDDPTRASFFNEFPNHVTYTTVDNIRLPRLLDRSNHIRRKLNNISYKKYHELANKELHEIHERYGKQIILGCHTTPDRIKQSYPESTVCYSHVPANEVKEAFMRMEHFNNTHWRPHLLTIDKLEKMQNEFYNTQQYADHIVDWKIWN